MLSKIIVHKVGNSVNQENLFLTDELLSVDEQMNEVLSKFFLEAIKSEEQFQFYSDSYLANNPVYGAVADIFEDGTTFIDNSKIIARHLYSIAENPRVQGGELFICYIEGEESDSGKIDSIGIFKTEKKDAFLKVNPLDNGAYVLEKDFGIALSKPDKCAIIHNSAKEDGFVLSVADFNKSSGDYYWFEDFLKIKQRAGEYFHTSETLAVYKDYITRQLPQEFEISRIDQADFLNKSIHFFKEKEQFDFEEFTSQVLEDKNVIESFVNFKTEYEQERQVSLDEEFPINQAAVKKQQRHFKSVIKLDKNFHIYVHGDRKMLETGQDEKGKYYRLYFEQEK